MAAVFFRVLSMSIAASFLIAAVILVRTVFSRGPKWIAFLLWAMVAVKLICPVQLESRFALSPSAMLGSYQEEYCLQHAVSETADINEDSSLLEMNGYDRLPLAVSSWSKAVVSALPVVWYCGLAVMIAYPAVWYLKLRRKARGMEQIGEIVYASDDLKTPFIFGLVSPRIIVPSGVEEKHLQNVLRHEMSHIRRGDQWWKLLGYLILAINWFDPLVWIAYALFSRDIEFACDERVIKDMNREEIADYSQTLLDCSGGKKAAAALPAFSETAVKARVKRMLNYKKRGIGIAAASLLVCIIIGVCFMTVPASANNADGEWVWPCDSRRVTFHFGVFVRPFYNQTDFSDHVCIGAEYGDNVYAAASGTVVSAGFDEAYGNCIMIRHDIGQDEIKTVYRCLSSIHVKEGESVSAGQLIGLVGDTGSKATGPHLAFCVFLSGKAVDPFDYIERPDWSSVSE